MGEVLWHQEVAKTWRRKPGGSCSPPSDSFTLFWGQLSAGVAVLGAAVPKTEVV